MSRLVSAKCPECDARLDLEFGQPTARCPFCGTLSRVQGGGRSTWFPAFGGDGADAGLDDLPVIKLHDPLRWVWAVGVVGGLVVLVVAAYFSFQKISGPADDADTAAYQFVGTLPGEELTWDGETQAMVVDVNGDGYGDPVGWVRFPNPRGGYQYHLAAFNAVDGARLWLSERLSLALRLQYSRAAIVQNTLIHVDSGGLLRALSLASGDVIWAAVMGDRAYQICDGGPGLARVELKSNNTLFVALRDGQVVDERPTERGAGCDIVWSDRGGVTPWHLTRFSLGGAERELPEIDGVEVGKAVYDVATGAAAALGFVQLEITKQEHLLGFDPRTPGPRRGRHRLARWTIPVYEETNDFTARLELPVGLVAAHGRLAVLYGLDGSWRLTVVDIATGQRLFDRGIPVSGTSDIDGLTASTHQLFVSSGDRLHVLDITNGDYRMTIGR